MEPVFGMESVIFLVGSLSIPFLLLVLLAPVYEYIDRERARVSSVNIPSSVSYIPRQRIGNGKFHERWLYTGSTEIGITVLSLTLLLAVSTSSKPHTYFFSAYPSTTMHTIELIAQFLALFYIGCLSVMLVNQYRRNNSGNGPVQEITRALFATLTILAPGLYYILFRMEWRIL